MAKRLFMFIAACLLTVSVAFAQTTASGKVVDAEDGSPIIGASIIVKGSNPIMGAATNADGSFTINGIPSQYKTVVVSYIGMKTQELTIKKGMVISLVSDSKVIDDVVITALGISRDKKSLGYAQQQVKADELVNAAPVNVTSALSGKVAGAQVNTMGGTVGASAVISIRGNSSFGSEQQPLIVVDGVPINNSPNRSGDNAYNGVDFGNGLNDINPEDIESIDVLKGGAAALYGMRAANGVILITTKKGNGNKRGTVVSYDTSITFDQVANIPRLQNMYGQGYNGDEYHHSIYGPDMSYQDYAENFGFSYVDGAGNGVNDSYDESWGPRLDAGLNLIQYDSDGQKAPWISRKNNVKDFFQTGVTQNHIISIASTTESGKIRASVSYRDQKGTVPNTDQTRYGGSFGGDIKLNKMVWMDVNGSFTHTRSDNLIGQGYGSNNPMISLLEWTGRQVNMQTLKDNWDQKDPTGEYTMYNWNSSFHVNPYFNVHENTNSLTKDHFIGKGSLFVQPVEWLKFEARLGVDTYNSKTQERVLYNSDYVDGYYGQRIMSNTEVNGDLLAMFNKTWDKFNVNAIVGANYRNNAYSYDDVTCDGLTVPGVYTLANATSPVSSTSHSNIRSNSVYGSLSLGWDNYLYLDATARNDWSSTLSKSFFYPSVSVSWLPLEAFKINSPTLSFLKLRGIYSELGNATSAYRTSYYYYARPAAFNGTTLMYKSNVFPNFDLQPERTNSWEVGLELGMFRNRLHLDLAYYSKSTKNHILNVSTAQSSGISAKLINAGEITNKGIEIQLSGDIIKTKDFTWKSSFNFSHDQSKVISLAEGLDQVDMGWSWGISTVAKVGGTWGDIQGVGYSRDDNGAIKLGPSCVPETEGSAVIGNIMPKALLSWRHDFNWKQWSAGFMLDMRIGGDIYSQTMAHSYCAGSAITTAENGIREKAITPGIDFMTNEKFVIDVNGDGNYVPATKDNCLVNAQDWFEGYTYGLDEMYTFNGSFLKFRELYLTYRFPSSLMKKTKYISGASISFVGNNLALLWVHSSNKLRIDPEAGGVASNSYGLGYEQAGTPSCRSFGFKVNLSF